MNKNIEIKISYTAADSIPLKVLLDKELISYAEMHNRMLPIHIQILPTNKCNMNCSFCSCSNRDNNLELDIELAKEIIVKYKKFGTKAVTITGGGEPLLYSHFDELVHSFYTSGIKIGLVTNGLLLKNINSSTLDKITWCRISNDDSRTLSDSYRDALQAVVNKSTSVDWAFSHVVSHQPNHKEIIRLIDFANAHNFTHIRLVADLFQPEGVNMEELKEILLKYSVDDSRVVYQGRKAYERGGDCYIGYIKPLIGPDAKVYACCGVQYALETPSKDLPEQLCLGNAIDIDKIVENSDVPLNGGVCVKCYYTNYNTILRSLVKKVVHKEFI